MLAKNIGGVNVSTNVETIIAEWQSDGDQACIGFTGTGSYSGLFKLSIVEKDVNGADINVEGYYAYMTSPSNRTAYIADRAFRVPAGKFIRLTVEHDSVDIQTFYGTILGGGY